MQEFYSFNLYSKIMIDFIERTWILLFISLQNRLFPKIAFVWFSYSYIGIDQFIITQPLLWLISKIIYIIF